MKKYEFTDETRERLGRTLHRIVAIRDFADVKAGDKGGWIEHDGNLSHEGNCWVYGNAEVFAEAKVYGEAEVYGNAQVYGDAMVYDNAEIHGQAKACGIVALHGNVELCGTADVGTDGDYIVFKNWWSSGRYFTWTRSNNLWRVGCFYGTGEELIQKAYEDSEMSGREYERIVRYVDEILKAEEE